MYTIYDMLVEHAFANLFVYLGCQNMSFVNQYVRTAY